MMKGWAGDCFYVADATALAAAATRPGAVRFGTVARTALRAGARRAAPREVCGLLAGALRPGPDGPLAVVQRFVALPNLATAADRFGADPLAFLRAEAAQRRRGRTVLGFAHSHPFGPPTLSAVDRRELWREHVQVVVAPDRDGVYTATAWWLDRAGDVAPLPIASAASLGRP